MDELALRYGIAFSDPTDPLTTFAAQPDVVLSDVPEMDGRQLMQWIALHHPVTRTLLMSGYDAIPKAAPFLHVA